MYWLSIVILLRFHVYIVEAVCSFPVFLVSSRHRDQEFVDLDSLHNDRLVDKFTFIVVWFNPSD